MARAIWNGAVLAESDSCIEVEGNLYFPRGSLREEHFRCSAHHTRCGWKGTASYYDVVVGDRVNRNAAWHYPEPLPGAEQVRDRVAFWNGVTVER